MLFVGMARGVYSSIFFATPIAGGPEGAGAAVQGAQQRVLAAAGGRPGRGAGRARAGRRSRSASAPARRRPRRRDRAAAARTAVAGRPHEAPARRRRPRPGRGRVDSRPQARRRRPRPSRHAAARGPALPRPGARPQKRPRAEAAAAAGRPSARKRRSTDLAELVAATLIDVPDFPKPGVVFKDLSPLFADGPAFRRGRSTRSPTHGQGGFDVVAGIEARGFLLAAAVAYATGAGVVPVRKAGKLPRRTLRRATSWSTAGDAGGARRTRSPATGCWWSTTCSPPAAPPAAAARPGRAGRRPVVGVSRRARADRAGRPGPAGGSDVQTVLAG